MSNETHTICSDLDLEGYILDLILPSVETGNAYIISEYGFKSINCLSVCILTPMMDCLSRLFVGSEPGNEAFPLAAT